MRSEIDKIFMAYLRKTFTNVDVVRFLQHHPKRGICVDNLCAQIAQCERRALQISFDSTAYVSTVESVARMFADAALKLAEERALTHNEYSRRVKEANSEQNAMDMVQEWKDEGALIERTRVNGVFSDGQTPSQK